MSQLDTTAVFAEVLLVEDEPGHAQLIARALRDIVGAVNVVHSSTAALQALTTTLPELVFCDLNLPDISGLKLLEAIQEARPGLPVIMMTSSIRLDDAVAAMREGAWDYMIKQFSEDFKSRLQIVVTRCAERKMQELREIQVRAERDAFSNAVKAAIDGVAILDSQGTAVFANEAFRNFCRMVTGETLDESLNAAEVIARIEQGISQDLLKQMTGTGSGFWKSELKVPNPADAEHPFYFELTLSSIRYNAGHEGLNRSMESFNLRTQVLWVKDITTKKAQEKFQRDILSTTSHDLKGPLGAILTSSELLTEKLSGDQKLQDLVTRVGSCARNCITLIDELLSARRIQDGVLIVRPRLYPVDEILNDLFLDYLPMAKAKKLTFFHVPAGEVIRIFADKIGLHRLLANLISNAIKFSAKGGTIEISAARIGDATRVCVRDTGCGIEPEACHKLFERYSRLEKHQEVEGTGLGLFVAKSIVDAHGGKIEVQSEVDVGTSFFATFPDGQEAL